MRLVDLRLKEKGLIMKSADELKQILKKIGIALDDEACQQFQTYIFLLEKWNSSINLTASSNWQVIGPFLQEGIWASTFYPAEATAHLDIGSGAGFPAIPLRILVPRMQLDIVESRAKRAIFLETVAEELGLAGICVNHARLNSHLQSNNKVWDCISWKGLKLRDRDLQELRHHSHSCTQFWMFHGKEMALEDPETVRRGFKLLRSERFPFRRDWMLSVYLPI